MNSKSNREPFQLNIAEAVGGGYNEFWKFKGRYRVVKGSRASKKSKTAALYFIYNMVKYPQANLLVVRKTFRTVKDSCFTELKWAINRLNLQQHWSIKGSPLEMTYLPTGQKIFFRGLDDPLKITSITVETGVLCWLWIEEAYEISAESDFDMLDESIRGSVPDGLFKQITLTLNPWNEHHWIKHRFFDETVGFNDAGNPVYKQRDKPVSDDGQILAVTTNYLCNEFLDGEDMKVFERMKRENPKRYRVAGLGNWGVTEGVIFENWEERNFDVDEIRKIKGIQASFGLDFGYVNDPSALFCGLFDIKSRTVYVFDEMYSYGINNRRIFDYIRNMGYSKERIFADSAEPKSIDELRSLGLTHIAPAHKGKDSILHGIQFLQGFKLVVHPRCVNFITEISNYTWQSDKFGTLINRPSDDFNHLMDAMRYASERFFKPQSFSFD